MKLRRYRPHLLSEPEERLLTEISPVGASSWNRLFEKVISQTNFSGRVEEEVLAELYNPDREIRIRAARDFTEGLSSQLHILTHIFNTILADMYAPLPISSEKIVPWNEGREMVLKAYNDFSRLMKEIAGKFFEGRWIHAPIMPGKIGGAFSDPCTPDVHPYVMLNYSGNNRDVQTLAHELGHGIHQYLAGRQGYLNSQTPLITSETASVFGEMLVFRSLLEKTVDRDEKLSLLSGKLEEIFATVFRQIAMNRFEDAVHRERRSHGELSPERFGEHWMDTQKEIFGNSVTL